MQSNKDCTFKPDTSKTRRATKKYLKDSHVNKSREVVRPKSKTAMTRNRQSYGKQQLSTFMVADKKSQISQHSISTSRNSKHELKGSIDHKSLEHRELIKSQYLNFDTANRQNDKESDRIEKGLNDITINHLNHMNKNDFTYNSIRNGQGRLSKSTLNNFMTKETLKNDDKENVHEIINNSQMKMFAKHSDHSSN